MPRYDRVLPKERPKGFPRNDQRASQGTTKGLPKERPKGFLRNDENGIVKAARAA
ncbi:hypothetical protein [Prevotella sp. OH937_COT-195]|uniref:hypothetical protein n=1 Tax=Prevotella sp. OH937_COT-195 TaxID=2491051 RepID=UPI001315A249|nr:hypothetical protein [Prevotella sp. OH937_COT-195]